MTGDLTNIEYVKGLQSNVRAVFDTAQGKEVMRFLEMSCGWYQSVFSEINRDVFLVNDGRRQVVATLKTLLEFSPDDIVNMAKSKE